jgi:hypothetical protein
VSIYILNNKKERKKEKSHAMKYEKATLNGLWHDFSIQSQSGVLQAQKTK